MAENHQFASERRWHDRDPEIAQAIDSLKDMSPEHQQVFAQVITMLCENMRDQKKRKGILLELGAEKLKGLMKSQNKRRWYDQNSALHKAVTGMFVLEDEQRLFLSQRVNHAVFYVREYALACERRSRRENLHEVVELIRDVIQGTSTEAAGEKFLRKYSLWDPKTKLLPPTMPAGQVPTPERILQLDESDEGMYLHSRENSKNQKPR